MDKSRSIYDKYVPALTPKSDSMKNARIMVFNHNRVIIRMEGERGFIPSHEDLEGVDTDFINRQYLGELDGCPCWCMECPDDICLPKGMEFKDLRSLLGVFDEGIFMLIGRAFQLVNWNRLNKFCGKCGSLTEVRENERSRKCLNCNSVFYPRISPAIIVAITRDDKILLAHNKNFRQNWYSVIAGFVEPGETFEECVQREVMEEVGIKVKSVRYFGSQPWPFPDSMMVGFTAEWAEGEIKVDEDEIDDAEWFTRDNLPQRPTSISISTRLIEWFRDKK